MAKTKVMDAKAATGGDPTRDKASQEETHLRAYHALGKKVLDRIKEGRLDADTLQRLSAETGYGFDAIRKARVFAVRYSAGQLDELCRLRTPEGKPLPWRHVRMLLMIPPGEGRDALQRKAAERGWSLEELIAAIPKKVRREQTRREGGRAFRGPKNQADALRQIVRHGEEWLRRHGSKAWAGDDWLESKVGAAWPGGLGARLAEAQEALRKVRESVVELESKPKRVEAAVRDSQPRGSSTPRPDLGKAEPRGCTRDQR